MIKLIIIVAIIIFIVIPLYRGESVSSVVNNIAKTIDSIRTGTPTWVKELIVKVFSVAFRLIQAVFRTVVEVIFDEAKRGVNEKLDEEKESIANDVMQKLQGVVETQ